MKVTIAIARTCLYPLCIWVLACTGRASGEGEPTGLQPASNGGGSSRRPEARGAGPVVAGRELAQETNPDADTSIAAMALQEAPDRRIREGLPIPAFDFPSLGEAGRRISNAALRGDVVLLEFWVSSCRFCVDEIANLDALHERYAPRGLAIVSINMFESPETVRAFRRDRWPMPWRHVVIEDEKESERVARTFEAAALPTSILIDREGRIAATGAAARGAKLDEALAQLFSAERR